jgi:hypothetical protein
MRQFYWPLLRQVPGLLWTAGDRALTIGAIIVALLTALNKELASAVSNTFDGVSPAWALLPVAALFLYGLAKANYKAFTEIEGERDTAQERADRAESEPRQIIGYKSTADAPGAIGTQVQPGGTVHGIARVGEHQGEEDDQEGDLSPPAQ